MKTRLPNLRYSQSTTQTKYVSTEVASGFTGVMIGLYAQGNEDIIKNKIF